MIVPFTPFPFGFSIGKEISVVQFGLDSEGLDWFVCVDAPAIVLSGLKEIGQSQKAYGGRCIDMAEYLSPFPAVVEQILASAPEETDAATISREGSLGTHTWQETARVTFYQRT